MLKIDLRLIDRKGGSLITFLQQRRATVKKILSSMTIALIMLTVSFVLTMGTDALAKKAAPKKPKATIGIEETKAAPYQLLAAANPKKAAPKKKK